MGEDFIAALDFYIPQRAYSEEKLIWRGIRNKVFKSGTLYVVEILFTLGHSVMMIFILQKYINVINGNF